MTDEQGQPNLEPALKALALQIIEQFRGDHAGLLERWLAFRIAELIFQADQSSDQAEKAVLVETCTNLILQVWNERSRWNQGWPPESAAGVIEALRRDKAAWEEHRLPDGPELTWTNAIPAFEGLLQEERRLWQLVALGSADMTDAQGWLDTAPEMLDDVELTTLAALLDICGDFEQLPEQQIAMPKTRGSRQPPADPAQRAKWLIKELRAIHKRKIALAEAVAVAVANLPRATQTVLEGRQ